MQWAHEGAQKPTYFVVVVGDAAVHVGDAMLVGLALVLHAARERAQDLTAALSDTSITIVHIKLTLSVS